MPESPGAEKQDKEKDHRDSKKSRGETAGDGSRHSGFIFILTHSQIPPSSAMKTSVSMDSSDQKKTRMKLKKFLIRRPTYQAVRDKGYIKGRTRRGMCVRLCLERYPSRRCVFWSFTDQVFGCSLTSLCQRENTSTPNFVKTCIEHVENTGTTASSEVSAV